jgi:hypothetical protein
MKSIWTDEAIAQLNSLWAEGKSGSEIAVILGQGLTRCSVLGKLHRLRDPKITNYARPPGRKKTASTPGAKSGVKRVDRTRTNNGSRPVPKPSLPLLTTLQPPRRLLGACEGISTAVPLGTPATLG